MFLSRSQVIGVREMLVRDIYLIQNFHVLYEKKIVLFGAGKKGKDTRGLLEMIGVTIDSFSDNNEKLWGTTIDGIDVLAADKLLEKGGRSDDMVIIISMVHSYDDVANQLEDMGFACPVFTLWGLDTALLMNMDCERIPQAFREHYKNQYQIDSWISRSEWNLLLSKIALSGMKDFYSRDVNILVYQAGKVASTSITESLNKYTGRAQHLHSLSYHDELFHGAFLEEWNAYLKQIKSKKMKIITLVREPLSRDYAMFWQLINTRGFLKQSQIISNNWQEVYDKMILTVGNEFNWFNREMKHNLGIDIYSYPFDKQKGYQIIKQGNIEVLTLKFELLSKNIDVIGKFVGVENFELCRSNDSNDKPIRYAYNEFKKECKISQKYVDSYYNLPYFNHFYNQNEKTLYLEKWKDNIY